MGLYSSCCCFEEFELNGNVILAYAFYFLLLMRLLAARLLMALKTNIQRYPQNPIAAGSTNTIGRPPVYI